MTPPDRVVVRLRRITGWAGTVMNLAATRLAPALILLLLTALLGPAAAQAPEKVPRVGYISPGSSSDPARLRRFEAFRQGLRELGYVEGQSIVLEPRWAEGRYDRYPPSQRIWSVSRWTSSSRWVGQRPRRP